MSKINFKPQDDRILVKQFNPETKTASGIILPGESKDLAYRGEVIAIGAGVRNRDGSLRPINVNVGDTIIFGKFSYNEIKLDDEEFLVMREDDVIGILG
jgi:chaperonin GroES